MARFFTQNRANVQESSVSRNTQYTYGNTSQKPTKGGIIYYIYYIYIHRAWKKLEPPKINKWLETVEDIYSMEKVTYKINKNKELLEKRWAFFKLSKGN